MNTARRGTLSLAAIALLLFPTTPNAGTIAPITGYGELQFGVTRESVETAYPNCKWECADQPGDAQMCTAQEPGITDMDQVGLFYIGGTLGKVIMTTRTVNSNLELLSAWDKYKAIFIAKYGAPSSISEIMLSPYDNTRAEFLQYGSSAINAGRCLYAATWSGGAQANAPGVSLMVKPGWVLIAYESTMFQDYADKLSAKDAEKF